MADRRGVSRRGFIDGSARLAGTAMLAQVAGAAQPTAEPAGTGAAASAAAELRTEFVLEARVRISPALTVGPSSQGVRRLIPIVGGTFSGPRISGEVLPGGADWQWQRPDGVTTVEARYTIRASDGTLISVANRGLIAPGPPAPYVRTTPEFEAPIGPHDWLNKAVFLGTIDGSEFAQGLVRIRVFRVV